MASFFKCFVKVMRFQRLSYGAKKAEQRQQNACQKMSKDVKSLSKKPFRPASEYLFGLNHSWTDVTAKTAMSWQIDRWRIETAVKSIAHPLPNLKSVQQSESKNEYHQHDDGEDSIGVLKADTVGVCSFCSLFIYSSLFCFSTESKDSACVFNNMSLVHNL